MQSDPMYRELLFNFSLFEVGQLLQCASNGNFTVLWDRFLIIESHTVILYPLNLNNYDVIDKNLSPILFLKQLRIIKKVFNLQILKGRFLLFALYIVL